MQKQCTIKEEKILAGIGLHSGNNVTMRLKPAPEDTGIIFVRVDLPGQPSIPARAAYVSDTRRATTLGWDAAKIHTAEHLMAALSAQGVDNLYIEMDSAEPPVADGSAHPFMQLLEEAGVIEQHGVRSVIKVTEPVWVRHGDRYLVALPYDGFRISCLFINPHPLIGTQYGDYEITREVFCKEIAPARTIGFMHEVEALKAQGLALGGSPDNAIVFDHDTVLTPLRFEDEVVRHKILDIVGDLALLGPVEAHIIAAKSSHALNTELARYIYERYSQVNKEAL
jgi:UDP-3-O-[3-hydroxymyristoyl] N-acetylglucosamine deacetylase